MLHFIKVKARKKKQQQNKQTSNAIQLLRFIGRDAARESHQVRPE